jgi:uncharacterized membrane protein (DUF4010 family)
MILLVWAAPVAPLDPWQLLSPKKVATMILALTIIQVLGSTLVYFFGAKAGSILTGFLGGLISSTATTAALAKRSKASRPENLSAENLTFLAATGAMLLEGVALVITGTTSIHWRLLLVVLGPLFVTTLILIRYARKDRSPSLNLAPETFRILPILKLTAFIAGVLALSKVLQNAFGQSGLVALTFLVSLFEIHGSVIANVQLHESGAIDVAFLGDLLAISVAASYVSKLFLIYTLGSRSLRLEALKSTSLLFLTLLASWFVSAGIGTP